MFSYIVLPKLLLYVGLPRIQGPSRQSRQEKLGRILEWLERRNVERILTLRMPDLEHNPYRDDDIVKYLTKFKEVEELNWEKLDMSLEILGDGDGNIHGVKKVWLYSASWGMISYWTSREGIINYPQVIPSLPCCSMILNTISLDYTCKYYHHQGKSHKLLSTCRYQLMKIIELDWVSESTIV
jgi:hypothetical protein